MTSDDLIISFNSCLKFGVKEKKKSFLSFGNESLLFYREYLTIVEEVLCQENLLCNWAMLCSDSSKQNSFLILHFPLIMWMNSWYSVLCCYLKWDKHLLCFNLVKIKIHETQLNKSTVLYPNIVHSWSLFLPCTFWRVLSCNITRLG